MTRTPTPTFDRIKDVDKVLLITLPEAGYLLGVDPATARRYVYQGILPAIKLPRSPISVEEANGKAPKRKTKEGYRVSKEKIAEYLHESIESINARLIEYYRENPTAAERRKAAIEDDAE